MQQHRLNSLLLIPVSLFLTGCPLNKYIPKIPINKNEKVAELKVYFKDELLGNYDLLALENIKKQNIISRLLTSINFLLWGDV